MVITAAVLLSLAVGTSAMAVDDYDTYISYNGTSYLYHVADDSVLNAYRGSNHCDYYADYRNAKWNARSSTHISTYYWHKAGNYVYTYNDSDFDGTAYLVVRPDSGLSGSARVYGDWYGKA